jgi:hypothetical protein
MARDRNIVSALLRAVARPRPAFASLAAMALLAMTTTAMADQVSREQDIQGLRLGQRILVDDGSCPAGEIKEVSGAQMTSEGILRVSKCVPRLGPKKR